MAKGRNGKDKGEAKVASDPTPDVAPEANGIGHNGGPKELTDPERQALALQWMKKLAAAEALKDEAVSEIRSIRKKIKAELGADGPELVKDMMTLGTVSGESQLRARMERARLAAKYVNASLYTQFEMFDEDRTPAIDRARAEGRKAGMEGLSLKPPYAHELPQFDAFTEGWHDGQKALFSIERRNDGALFDQAESGSAELDVLHEDMTGTVN